MKHFTVFLLALFLFFEINLTAQNSGVSVELHYPYVSSNSNNNYSDVNGIFGGVVRFQFTDNDFANYGISYQFDMSQTYEKNYINDVNKLNFLMNHIDGFVLLKLDDVNDLQFLIQSGFTFYKYKENNYQPGFTGFNIGGGLQYPLNEKFYIHATYNWLKATIKQKQTNFVDGEKYGIVRAGIGFNI